MIHKVSTVMLVLFLAFLAFAYLRNPVGSQKLWTDFGTLAASVTSTSSNPAPNEPGSPPDATNSAPPAPTSAAEPIATTPPPPPASVTPSAPHLKPWSPPAVLPAQPNWTWTTLDGTTYQNVVVTKVEPDTVSITHSLGVAHISMATLPPDLQKQLNYDPEAASAARAELQREDEHPYYTYANRSEAQTVAADLNRPLAWVISSLDCLSTPDPAPDGEADLTQMVVNYLKTRAVVIFSNENDNIGDLPAVVRDQFFHLDDGPMPGGHHFYAPKVVFTNADISKVYGRAFSTQMKTIREVALDEVLNSIPADNAPAAPASIPAAPPSPAPAPAPTNTVVNPSAATGRPNALSPVVALLKPWENAEAQLRS